MTRDIFFFLTVVLSVLTVQRTRCDEDTDVGGTVGKAGNDAEGLLDGPTDLVEGVVNKANGVADGALGDAGNIANNAAKGLLGGAGNIVTSAAEGVLGSAGNIASSVLKGGVGNLPGKLVETVLGGTNGTSNRTADLNLLGGLTKDLLGSTGLLDGLLGGSNTKPLKNPDALLGLSKLNLPGITGTLLNGLLDGSNGTSAASLLRILQGILPGLAGRSLLPAQRGIQPQRLPIRVPGGAGRRVVLPVRVPVQGRVPILRATIPGNVLRFPPVQQRRPTANQGLPPAMLGLLLGSLLGDEGGSAPKKVVKKKGSGTKQVSSGTKRGGSVTSQGGSAQGGRVSGSEVIGNPEAGYEYVWVPDETTYENDFRRFPGQFQPYAGSGNGWRVRGNPAGRYRYGSFPRDVIYDYDYERFPNTQGGGYFGRETGQEGGGFGQEGSASRQEGSGTGLGETAWRRLVSGGQRSGSGVPGNQEGQNEFKWIPGNVTYEYESIPGNDMYEYEYKEYEFPDSQDSKTSDKDGNVEGGPGKDLTPVVDQDGKTPNEDANKKLPEGKEEVGSDVTY